MPEPHRAIILASGSPRRRALLKQLGLTFTVDASNGAELPRPGLEARALAAELSLAKARAVAPRHHDALVIAADTFGLFHHIIIGKPGTPAEARRVLRMLSGNWHLVITGLTVLDTKSGKAVTDAVETRVHFRRLTAREIAAYVTTGEPLDKAGAYAIQGLGAVLVDRIDGDYYNVVGLPLARMAEMLAGFGVRVLRPPPKAS